MKYVFFLSFVIAMLFFMSCDKSSALEQVKPKEEGAVTITTFLQGALADGHHPRGWNVVKKKSTGKYFLLNPETGESRQLIFWCDNGTRAIIYQFGKPDALFLAEAGWQIGYDSDGDGSFEYLEELPNPEIEPELTGAAGPRILFINMNRNGLVRYDVLLNRGYYLKVVSLHTGNVLREETRDYPFRDSYQGDIDTVYVIEVEFEWGGKTYVQREDVVEQTVWNYGDTTGYSFSAKTCEDGLRVEYKGKTPGFRLSIQKGWGEIQSDKNDPIVSSDTSSVLNEVIPIPWEGSFFVKILIPGENGEYLFREIHKIRWDERSIGAGGT